MRSIIYRQFRPPFSSAAFSLVEVMMSLGIITFAMVTLMGLIPLSLNTYQEAAQRTVQVTILDQLAAKSQKMPYAQLADLTTQEWTFDRAGYEVENSSSEAYFTARLSKFDTVIPSSPEVTTTNLTTFKVEVFSLKTPQSPEIFNLHVANAGL